MNPLKIRTILKRRKKKHILLASIYKGTLFDQTNKELENVHINEQNKSGDYLYVALGRRRPSRRFSKVRYLSLA